MALPFISRIVLASARPSARQLTLRHNAIHAPLASSAPRLRRSLHSHKILGSEIEVTSSGMRRASAPLELEEDESDDGQYAVSYNDDADEYGEIEIDEVLLTSDERHELDHFFRGGGERQVEDSMSFLELGERTAAKVFLNTSDTSRLTAAAVEKEAGYWLPDPAAVPLYNNLAKSIKVDLARHEGTEEEALMRPKTGAHFMGPLRSVYFDKLYELETLRDRLKAAEVPEVTIPAPVSPWKGRADMEAVMRCDLKSVHYRRMVTVLNDMLKDPRYIYVADELRDYMRPSALAGDVGKVHTVDIWGRMHAIGRRKTSIARVWIAPGSGRVLINKLPLVDYFPRLMDRQAVLAPFVATGTPAQFDVYARVVGGGTTGQSNALRHGIAVALQRLRPDLRPPLRAKQDFGNHRVSLLTRDIRKVERKKPGQKKARKKFAWVKR